jgi:hypothetical protein
MEDRRLWTLALVFGMVASLADIAATVLPLYIFDGNVDGYVSLISYDIKVFGEQYYSLSLDAIKSLSYIILVQAALNIIVVTVCYDRVFSDKNVETWKGIAFGTMLSMFIWFGVLYGCTYIASEEIKSLLADFSHETSAGKIVFPKTMYYPQPAYFLVSNFIPLAFSILYAITLSLACEESWGCENFMFWHKNIQ